MIIGPKEKLCKDCRYSIWCYTNRGEGTDLFCSHGITITPDLVYGNYIANYTDCVKERSNNLDYCGSVAKYYSRKWWKIFRPK